MRSIKIMFHFELGDDNILDGRSSKIAMTLTAGRKEI